MRRFPVSWSETLVKLGFRRRINRSGQRKEVRRRQPQYEALEERQLLSITVNTTQDSLIANDGLTSLREALALAASSSHSGDDTIDFSPSLFSDGPATITLGSSGQLVLDSNVTIQGPGADKLAINGNNQTRVAWVNSGVTATLNGLTITGGNGVSEGGAIFNSGDLTLDQVVVTGNQSSSTGGAITSRNGSSAVASLHLIESTVDSNHSAYGAALDVDLFGGVLEIGRSTISNNSYVGTGYAEAGALRLAGSASSQVTIFDTTIANNRSTYNGGIRVWYGSPKISIVNSTIANNIGDEGGGISDYTWAGLITLNNTIVAKNTTNSGANVDMYAYGNFDSTSSHNLIGTGASGLSASLNPKMGTASAPIDPRLLPLGDYGGSTQTIPLASTSPAIGSGSDALAIGIGQQPLTSDQRGFQRSVGGAIDIGATEVLVPLPDGDFNGDGRPDKLGFDLLTGALVSESPQGNSNLQSGEWGRLDTSGGAVVWSDFKVGDFNGDGRDDLVARKTVGTSKTLAFAISEGNRFQILSAANSAFTAYQLPWTEIYVGDFDGDKSDDVLGWNPTAGNWESLHYSEHAGFTLDSGGNNWGNAFRGSTINNATIPILNSITVGDANRDGRDDLVLLDSLGHWEVGLSQFVSGNNHLVLTDFGNWFNTSATNNAIIDTAHNVVDVNMPYDSFLKIFSQVYNNVELEVYPGLMKGPVATEATARGNDFDQAALLVKRLEDQGFSANISVGNVTVAPVDGFDTAAQWLGTTNSAAAFNVISGAMDNSAAWNGSTLTTTFKHAWVTALVPTMNGLEWQDIDPSWKYKDCQPGVPVDLSSSSGAIPGNRGTFDEFDYLSGTDATISTDQTARANELPVEVYEDQVMNYLISQNKNQSLADVPYDGPIIQQHFTQIPIGLASGVTVVDPSAIQTFPDADHISADLSHNATIEVSRDRSDVTFPSKQIDIKSLSVGQSGVHAWGGVGQTDPPPGLAIEPSSSQMNDQPAIKVEGRNYIVVPIPNGYVVTENTRVSFDFRYSGNRTLPTLYADVGLDTDSTKNGDPNGPAQGEEHKYTSAIAGFGSNDTIYHVESTGTLTQSYFNSLHQQLASCLILGLAQDSVTLPTSNVGRFSNIKIFEDTSNSLQQTASTPVIGSVADHPLAAPYTVTKNTTLNFEFHSTGPSNRFHAIGWDSDATNDTTNNSADSLRRFALVGSSSGYLSAPTATGITSDGYLVYSIPIGAIAQLGNQTIDMDRLRFFSTGTGAVSNFRNFSLSESIDATGGTNLSFDLSVPQNSLNSITLDFPSAPTTPSGVFNYQLKIGNQSPQIAGAFHTGDSIKLTISHHGPTALYSGNPADKTYTRSAGTVIAIGLDADQYSSEHLVDLQSGVNQSLSNGASVDDIAGFLAYAGTKYWYEYNRDNHIIDGLMHTVGAKQWVGSGIMSADKLLIAASDQPNAHLDFPIVPKNMGIDLPNSNHSDFDVGGGISHASEAFQLSGWNASALESATVEELIDAQSVSTVRGLMSAYKNTGHSSDQNGDWITVYESIWDGTQRQIYDRGAIGTNANNSGTTYDPAHTTSVTETSVGSELWAILNNSGDKYGGIDHQQKIRILVPHLKSVVGHWSGTVYVAEYQTDEGFQVGAYIIARDGGAPTNGGFSGDIISPENTQQQKGQYSNANTFGDPVSPANGNMSREETDVTMPNIGVPLDFKRYYNSQLRLDLPSKTFDQQPLIDVGLGPGWTHSFSDRLYFATITTGADLIWVTSTGEQHTFTNYDAATKSYQSPHELFGSLKGDSTDQTIFRYFDPDGTVTVFKSSTPDGIVVGGRAAMLYQKLDRDGNGIQVNYTGTPYQILSVWDVHDATRNLTFSPTARIETITQNGGSAGGTWSYGYQTINEKNFLISATTPPPLAGSQPLVTRYSYFSGSGVSPLVVGLMQQVTEPNGDYHQYEYYANGRVFRVKSSVDLKTSDPNDDVTTSQSYNYNLYRNLAQITDERGNAETDIYQTDGLLLRQIHPDRSRISYSWSTDSDHPGDEFLMKGSTDEVGATENYSYYHTGDANFNAIPGELKDSTNKDGIKTHYDYYQQYQLSSSYQYISELSQVIVDPGDYSGDPNHKNLITQYNRDPGGHLVRQTDPIGNVTAYTYSSNPTKAGLIATKTDPQGVSLNTAASWEVLNSGFVIDGDTLSVRLYAGADGSKYVIADAIRIDRMSSDGVFTRIQDDIPNGTDPNFRIVQAGTSVSGYVNGGTKIVGNSGNYATWIFHDLLPGTYRISATWISDPTTNNLRDNARYQFYNGLPTTTAQIDYSVSQSAPPNDFASFQTVYQYDAAGNVTSATTEGLPATVRTYDNFGNVLTAIDPTGAKTDNHYDALGRLKDTSVVSSATPTLPAVGTTLFTYDGSSQLLATTDALLHTTSNIYDKAGHITRQSYADGTSATYEYDAAGNRISSTDELGRKTQFVYDVRNRLIQTIFADGTSTRTRYDGAGRVLASFDELGHETDYTYDKSGRLLSTTLGVGTVDEAVSVNKYDSLGRRVESVDGNGIVTLYRNDALGRLVQTTVLDRTYTSANNYKPTTDPVRPDMTKAPITVTTIEYDRNGDVARTTQYDPPSLTNASSNGQIYSLLYTQAEFWAGTPGSHVTSTAYDAFGRPVTVTNSDGTTTSTVYDAAGRVSYTIDELGRQTRNIYDAYGRLQRTISPSVQDPSGATINPYTRYVYDSAGNIIESRQFVSGSGATAVELVDQSIYDSRNRLITSVRPDGTRVDSVFDEAGELVATVDAMGNASYMKRDARGRVIEEHEVDPDGAALADGTGVDFPPITIREYDAVGNLTATTDPLGNRTDFTYDSLNRPRTQSNYHSFIVDNTSDPLDSSFSTSSTVTYTPDSATAIGSDYALVKDTSGVAKAAWTVSHLDAGTYRISTTWLPSILWDWASTVRLYLDGVQINPVTSLNEQVAPVGFKEIDDGIEQSWQILFDGIIVGADATLKVEVTGAGGHNLYADAVRFDKLATTSYDYDNNGNITSTADTRGNTTSYTYDELNRQASIMLPDPDGSGGILPRPLTTSKYDGYGNVIEIRDTRGTTTGLNPTADDLVTTFVYDQRNRIKTKTVNPTAATAAEKQVTNYKYDAAGNTTDKIVTVAAAASAPVDVTTHYRYDNLNRVIDQYDDYGNGSTGATVQTANLGSPVPSFGDGSASLPGAAAITLTGNVWVHDALTTPYHATNRTVLDFDLLANSAAARIFIGFDTTVPGNFQVRSFELAGKPAGLITDFLNTAQPNQTVHVQIPIGEYLTTVEQSGLDLTWLSFGAFEGGVEAADLASAKFSNIKLYESDEVRTFTAYDALGNVATVQTKSDPRNIKTLYQYDKLGRQTDQYLDIGGPQERHTSTFYDANGNVLVERTPAPNSAAGSTATVDTVHTYDKLNRLTSTTLSDVDGNAATANGLVTKYKYDAAGRQTAQIQDATAPGATTTKRITTTTDYDSLGNIVATTDGNGHQTRYQYDSEGNQTAVTDPNLNTTTYTYDALGRETAETIMLPSGTSGALAPSSRTMVYDNHGDLAQTTDRDGRTRTYAYDTLDRQTHERWLIAGTSVDALEWRYDSLGRVIYERNGTSDTLPATTATAAAALGITTPTINTYKYDTLGRLVDEANYDPASAVNSAGVAEVRQHYDYSIKYSIGALTGGVFQSSTVRTQYRRATSTSEIPLAASTTNYDRLGQMATVSDKDLDPASTSPQFSDEQLGFNYDAPGNLQQITRTNVPNQPVLPLSEQVTYDNAGRVSQISHQTLPAITHNYTYDNASRITDFNSTAGSTTTPRHYTYDDAGQLLSKNGGSDPLAGDFFDYDANGNRVIQVSYNNGPFPLNPIGAANRLTSDGNFSYLYDPEGNVKQKTDLGNGKTTYYTWDYRNRLVSASDPNATATAFAGFGEVGQVEVSSLGLTVNLTGTYTKPVIILQLASGREIDHTTLRVNSFGPKSFQVQIDDWEAVTDRSHTAELVNYMVVEAGTYQLPNGGTLVADTTTKNNNNQSGNTLVNLPSGAFNATPVMLAQVMSANGNQATVARIQDVSASSFYVYVQSNQATTNQTIGYVAIQPGHGTMVGGAGTFEASSFIANSISNTGGISSDPVTLPFGQTYTGAPSPPPLVFSSLESWFGHEPTTARVTAVTSAGATVIAEDDPSTAPGHKHETAALVAFAQQGQLLQPVAPSIRYGYDAEGHRVQRTTDAGVAGAAAATTQSFAYSSSGNSGDQLSMQFGGATGSASVLQHRYLDGPDGQVLADDVFNSAGQSTDTLWLLGDQQGTIRDIVDANGTLRKHIDYDSTGNVTGQQFYDASGAEILNSVGNAAAVDQLFYYAGAERDAATGLAKMGARWYDPWTARFDSEDPTGFGGGDANLYRYVGNSFPNATDPTGESIKLPTYNVTPHFGDEFGAIGSTPSYSAPSFSAPSFNAFDPIGSITNSYSNASYASSSLSSGTLFNTAANVFSNTASSFVSPLAKTAIVGGVSLAGAAASQVVPYIGRNEEQSSANYFNLFSYYYSGYSGLSKHAELDRQIAANQLKEVMKQGGFDEIEALQQLQRNQAANAARDAHQLAETGIQFNAAALSGGFLRPGAASGEDFGGVAPKPIDASRPVHGSPFHDASAFNTAKAWETDAATVETRFNQQLVDASGTPIPAFRPDAQRIRITPSGKKVVDVLEVQSPGQSETFMKTKVQEIRKALGNQAGNIDWIPPVGGAKRAGP